MFLHSFRQRVRSSLRLRLTLLLTAVTAVLTITFTTFYISNEREDYLSRFEDKGNLLATILAEAIQLPLYAGHNEEIARQATLVSSRGDVSGIQVFSISGKLVASVGNVDSLSDISRLTITKQVRSEETQYAPENLLLGDLRPDQTIGTIKIQMDHEQLARLTQHSILVALLLSSLFWAVITSLTYFYLRKITSTFQQLMSGVRKIEAGDLTARIQTSDIDEAGRALTAINSLAEALQKRNEENQKLQDEIVAALQTQMSEEKTRHMAKLIQTNRMTSLGLLVSSMAHEINNPNGSIRLAAEIIEKGWKDLLPILDELSAQEGEFKICGQPYTYAVDDINTAVDAILRSSVRIERVVQNLRSYSLGERDSEHVAVDCNRVAENAVAIVRAHGKMENIMISTDLSPLLPAINGNPFQLEQVVINLLLNAIQATATADATNHITLSTEHDTGLNEVVLTVRDSGPGIATADLPHIFEPFFSTRIQEGGSGLGLYISNFLVQEQQGKLEIVNNADGGCRAIIRLPATATVSL